MEINFMTRTVLIVLSSLYSLTFIVLSIWQYHKTYVLKQDYLYELQVLDILEKDCGVKDEGHVLEQEVLAFLEKNGVLPAAIEQHSVNKRQTSSLQDFLKQLLALQETVLQQHCSSNSSLCVRGLKGEPGSKGETGIPGPPGDKGLPGLSGEKGLLGFPGGKGENGSQGVQGPLGDPGKSGPVGLPGISGDLGEKGVKGETGEPGDAGLKGDPGIQGINGLVGEHGLNGPAGDPGANGLKGQPGEQGMKGEPGPDGPMGKILDQDCVCSSRISQNNCNFDTGDTCSWKQTAATEDNFDWTSWKGPTDTAGTGPSTDHTTGTLDGGYLYIETSQNNPGDFAELQSHVISGNQVRCLSLWYHMFGNDIDKLVIGIKDVLNNYQIVKTITGEQDSDWHKLQVTVTSPNDYHMTIRGFKGNGFRGDIAIDDITVDNGSCV